VSLSLLHNCRKVDASNARRTPGTVSVREALIKAGFPNFSFPWLGLGPLRQKTAATTSRSQVGRGPNWLVGHPFSPLDEFWGVVFHAVACRAPISTLARPKSV
jgi:hypothetical protein